LREEMATCWERELVGFFLLLPKDKDKREKEKIKESHVY